MDRTIDKVNNNSKVVEEVAEKDADEVFEESDAAASPDVRSLQFSCPNCRLRQIERESKELSPDSLVISLHISTEFFKDMGQ